MKVLKYFILIPFFFLYFIYYAIKSSIKKDRFTFDDVLNSYVLLFKKNTVSTKSEYINTDNLTNTVLEDKNHNPLFMDKKIINDEISIKDLFLLNYLNGKDDKIILPVHFQLFSADKKIKDFIDKGYIVLTNNLEDSLNYLTIEELKIILRDNKLKLTGNKTDLIKRIIDNVDNEYLKKNFNKNKITLTEKGISTIKYNKALIYMNSSSMSYDTSIYEELYNTRKELPSKFSYRDVIWGVLNTRYIETENKTDIHEMENIQIERFKLLYEEKRYKLALLYLLAYFRLMISGMEYNKGIAKIDTLTIEPYFYTLLRQLLSKEEFNNKEIEDTMIQTNQFISSLPFNYFDSAEANNIFNQIINGESIDLKSFNYKELDKKAYEDLGYYIY